MDESAEGMRLTLTHTHTHTHKHTNSCTHMFGSQMELLVGQNEDSELSSDDDRPRNSAQIFPDSSTAAAAAKGAGRRTE